MCDTHIPGLFFVQFMGKVRNSNFATTKKMKSFYDTINFVKDILYDPILKWWCIITCSVI